MRLLVRSFPWLLFLAALAIRLTHYATADISMDEPFTLFHSQKPLAELMQLFEHENNPPLFFILMHFWIKLFGIEPESVRLVPVFISALTAPVLFSFGKRHFSLFSGVALSLVFLFTRLHQYHAHDVRAYSLFTLLTVWSMHHFLLLSKRRSLLDVLFLVIANTLLLYNHFLGMWVLFVQGLSVLAIKEYRGLIFGRFAVAAVSTAVLFAPYVLIMLKRVSESGGSGWLPPPDVSSIYNVIWSFSNEPVLAVAGICIWVLIPCWLFGVKRSTALPEEKTVFIWFLVPLVLMFVVSQWTPMFLDRYLIFIAPAFILGMIVLLTKVNFGKGLTVALVVGFMLTFQPNTGHEVQIVDLMRFVKSDISEDQPMLVAPEWNKLQVAYHVDREVFADYANLDKGLEDANIFAFHDANAVVSAEIPIPASCIFLNTDHGGSAMSSSVLEYLDGQFGSQTVVDSFPPFKLHYFSERK